MFNTRLKPVSNQGDWLCFIQMTDKDSGALLDLTGGSTPLSWTLEARLQGGRPSRAFIRISTADASGQLYVAALGVLGIWVPVGNMQTLEVGSYQIFLGVTNGAFTRQISLGLLPIIGKPVNIASAYGTGRYYGW